MKELKNHELNKITGGAISGWGIIAIIAGIIFGVGVVDGIVRPLKCE